jgi:hypothetical protein
MMELLEDRSLLSVFTVTDLGDKGTGFELQGDLRYCLTQANANDESSNQIQFQPGLTGTIVLTQGSLDITKDLEIAGPGQDLLTISGDHHSGVFNITANPRVQAVSIADLTIADGTGIRVGGFNLGGGLFNDHARVTLSNLVVTGNSAGGGGGIYTRSGPLTLNYSTVSGNTSAGAGNAGGGIMSGGGSVVVNSSLIMDNHAQPASSNGIGGGLFLGGPATITDSTISGNTAAGFGGGIKVFEPFPSNNRITVTRSAILGNQAVGGGGLSNNVGNVTIDNTIVSGNVATGGRTASGLDSQFGRMTITDSIISDNTGGSGIKNYDQLMISGSTISGNSTPYEGGGLDLEIGTATVVNSTFSGNTAGTSGGGTWMYSDPLFGGDDFLDLTSVTITGNVAKGVDSPFRGGGGVAASRSTNTRVNVRNSLIAKNTSASVGADVLGYVDSAGYNLVGVADDSSGWTSTDSLGHSFAPLDPLLGPLQDNGGPTPTHSLLLGSPAIDTGDFRLLNSLDQRGTVRLHNGVNPPVDVGAYDGGVRHALQIQAPAEVVAGEPFTVTVVALDPFGYKTTKFTESIHFSSSDGDASLPADYTFTSDDAGEATFSVTLKTEGSQQLVVNDLDFPLRASATVTVDPPAATGKPLAALADLFFGGNEPMDWWTPASDRKRARSTGR